MNIQSSLIWRYPPERLAKALSFKTVYTWCGSNLDWSRLTCLQYNTLLIVSPMLRPWSGWPLAHEIPGSQPKLPHVLMLIAHQDVVTVDFYHLGKAWTRPLWWRRWHTYVYGRGARYQNSLVGGWLLISTSWVYNQGFYLPGIERTRRSWAATQNTWMAETVRAYCLLDEDFTTFLTMTLVRCAWGYCRREHLHLAKELNVKLTATGHGGHSSNPFGGTMTFELRTLLLFRRLNNLSLMTLKTARFLGVRNTEEPFASLVRLT